MFQVIARRITTILRPGSAALWTGTLFLLLFAILVVQPLQPADLWWHLKVGEIVLDEGYVPQTDLFSYTVPDSPYIYQGWLAGVLFALVYRLGGAATIVVVNAALLTLAYALLWWVCRQESRRSHVATAGTLAAVVVSAGNWAPRPQTFSTVLVALFLLLLVRFRRKGRAPLWLLPLLVAFWANLHGAFVLGIALVGAALVGEGGKFVLLGRRPDLGSELTALPRRSLLALLATTLAALAAPLLNPVGWRIWAYVRTIQGNPVIRQAMAEWKPPRVDNAVGTIFFLSVLALFLLLLYRQHRPDPVEALWLVGTVWLALGGVRSILWYSFVMALLAAQGLSGLPLPRPVPLERWQTRLNLAILGLMAGLAILALPWCKGVLPLPPDLQGTISQNTPVQAVEFLEQEGLSGRLFHRMEYGGYLFWRFYPERRVFIDPRIELYPSTIWRDYAGISAGAEGTEALLDDYEVEVLLLDKSFQAGLLDWAKASAEWQLRYDNPVENSAILTRQEGPY